ncbi:hypothetical protein EYF80_033267 [Liparis tanakae]|uniref:Uncharacterized protein n=1 Tax=Liparis tanakae TaxID=230148 RepID=A0A4Z2GTA4_9TELE|nr:hypothetical protein EYF80_033267 [Liparis tanakae]
MQESQMGRGVYPDRVTDAQQRLIDVVVELQEFLRSVFPKCKRGARLVNRRRSSVKSSSSSSSSPPDESSLVLSPASGLVPLGCRAARAAAAAASSSSSAANAAAIARSSASF